MFKNIMGIMGDRRYLQPLSLIQDILVKIQDFIPLRNEFYAQIIKQLTQNPSKESRVNGWNLLTVILDTLKPPKDIENYLEKWLRDNTPENHPNDDEFYVRLLHQTIFLGSRQKIPTLAQIDQLMNGTNIRTLRISNNKIKPPQLSSVHEGQLEQQRSQLMFAQKKGEEEAFRHKVFYCGYTMDDERRPGNNWHYAPHPKPTIAPRQQYNGPGYNGYNDVYSPHNLTNSTTEAVKGHKILDL